MEHVASERIGWKDALNREGPLPLPVAHDGLTAESLGQVRSTLSQIAGFASSGAGDGPPDIDLSHFEERHAAVLDIMSAAAFPIPVDADDGYGDVKNVDRTVCAFMALGVHALFIEDQQAPINRGHVGDKRLVPIEQMAAKVKAAAGAKGDWDFFLLARTDALQPEGLEGAIRRGEKYLDAGADGVYVKGPTTVEQLEEIGKRLGGRDLATSVLEDGGKRSFLPPAQLRGMGYTMILYPATILFRATRAIRRAAEDLCAGRPLDPRDAVDMQEFQRVVALPHWQEIETRFQQ